MGERRKVVLAFVLGLIIATAGTATAAKLITGKQIKDGTITMKDLSKSVRAKVNKAGKRGPTGPTGTVDTSGFFTKSESDARYPQIDILETGGAYPVAVAPNTHVDVTSEICPNGYMVGKGTFEADGFEESIVHDTILPADRRYEVSISNVLDTPANGTLHVKVNCFQRDPAIVPEPQIP